MIMQPTLTPSMEPLPVPSHTSHILRHPRHTSRQQYGVSLLELMVGLAIGLLVVATAMGALMLSRGISGSVSDASNLQQQGAYALRVIGLQLRQAGSLRLNTDPKNNAPNDPLGAVVFETMANAHDKGNSFFDQTDTLSGTASALTTGFRRYADPVFQAYDSDGQDNLARNCVNAPAYKKKDGSLNPDERIESIFTFDSTKGNLLCGGNGAAAQPIVQNVAQFQASYLVQTLTGTQMQHVKGDGIATTLPAGDAAWRRVQGVQICLVLYGSEPMDMPAGSNYTDCDGKTVDITTLTDAKRKNRMHLLLRNTFQLRSQGLPPKLS